MSKPLLLDLGCGAGGGAKGYHDAGFEVFGVDLHPQPDYPFECVVGDMMTYPLDGFDAIHASPPCQGETSVRSLHKGIERERLLVPMLERLADVKVPWVVENVDNATAPPHVTKVRLCGSSFGLQVRRHRWFWSNMLILGLPCNHPSQTDVLGVYGHSSGPNGRNKGPRQATTTEAREVMGMPWATKRLGITNAIPPAYTSFVGSQLLAAVRGAEVV